MEAFDYIENKCELSVSQRALLVPLIYEPNQNVTFF
jgi:hypothetical protein